MKGNLMAIVKDVVCGMEIEPTEAVATSEYEGKTYYFCSVSCKEKFELDPLQYVHEEPGSAHPGT